MNTTPTSPSFSLGEASGKVIEGPSPISSSIESSSAGNSSIALDGPSGFQWLDGNGKRKPETVDLTLEDEPEVIDLELQDEPAEPPRPAKRQKTGPAVAKTAKAWIQDFDAKHPVPADDPDLQRFAGRMELLTRRLCQHARSGDMAAWYRLPQEEQDMSVGFKTELRKVDPVHLLHQGLSHMPRKVQQGFGKQDLQVYDLLSLPEFPVECPYHIVYVDVSTRVGKANIIQRVSPIVGPRARRLVKGSSKYDPSMDTTIYIGSSTSSDGGYARLREHELAANGNRKHTNKHWDFIKQEDVVPNFRMVGLWDTPGVLNQDDPYLPLFWEGLLMVYTGTYHMSHRTPGISPILSISSYQLVQELRTSLPLPDFHMQSLNKAWPIKQGLPIRSEAERQAILAQKQADKEAKSAAQRAQQKVVAKSAAWAQLLEPLVARTLLTQQAMDNAVEPQKQAQLAREYEILIADIQASGAPSEVFDYLLEKKGPENPNYVGPRKRDMVPNVNPNYVGPHKLDGMPVPRNRQPKPVVEHRFELFRWGVDDPETFFKSKRPRE
ncbi:hypothetical protein FMUND_7484 [Fusarium mundagurra]|uniref:Uncharacterized protein n=1 Tax=Fusarium mundagurra TaxID=1567541 RepID=A0A8H5YLH1_9HYPO|nr:hypothetical protein FMUND_7484 [Fusarium mundagurra]